MCRQESLRLILAQHPVTSAYNTPVYSNLAYQLLAMAYEGITGEVFAEAVYSHVARPLNLTRSFWDAPANDPNIISVPFDNGTPAEWSMGIQNP